jgi:small subunit ribosomal protein S17
MPKRILTGIITSDAMDKTVVVKVESIKQHKKYLRRYRSHKKYKAHDPENQYHIGEKVFIEETSPISKEKKWKVVKKV